MRDEEDLFDPFNEKLTWPEKVIGGLFLSAFAVLAIVGAVTVAGWLA